MSGDVDVEPAGPGRPMSPEVHEAIIDATNRMLETQSVGDLTINGIAKAAGVSRPAIYRRWSNPRDIALDAFLASADRSIPAEPKGNPETAFKNHVRAMVRFMAGRGGRIIAELVGEGQKDPEMLALFRERFLTDRRAQARALIEYGVEKGSFNPVFDPELVIDLYAGAIYHRALLHHGKLDRSFADQLANVMLRLLFEGHADADRATV